jgi:thiol-disulfide isomerase/thioredoxin
MIRKLLLLALLVTLVQKSIIAQTSLTTAVDFTVTDVHGNTHNLFTYLDDGKHVIVDFFFTTCPPCISSVPTMNTAFSNYGCNSGDLIFIAIDNGDSDAEVMQYENDYGGLLPTASGNDGGGNAVNSAYGISAYPTVILIAPDRTILEQDIFPVSDITTALPNAGLNMAPCDTGGSTTIIDISVEKEELENKIYDILGREWKCSFANLPKGLYIINNRKVLKTE